MNSSIISRSSHSFVIKMPVLLLAILAVSFLAVACGSDENTITASHKDGDPPGVESAVIVISDGEFDTDKLVVSTELATELTIRNEDGVAYQFEIEELVNLVDVEPSGDTQIDFTSPSSGDFHAHFFNSDGGEIDSLDVEVE